MAGRLNAHLWWDRLAPGVDAIRQGLWRYRRELARFAPGGETPRWTGPFFPDNPTIPNDTTVVVVTNGHVASAGEGFVMRMRQAENVVVVGENTHGALTFGNVSLHQLPRSGLMVWLPINLNLFPDLSLREELGLFPDLWVPAHDAVNRAVAALRAGTIPTVRPLGSRVLEADFVREDPLHRRRRALVGAVGLAAGALLAWRMRRRGRAALPLGLAWLLIGALWLWLGRTRGPLLTDGGLAFLGFGLVLVTGGLLLRLSAVRATRHGDQAVS
jgi:hypothetical protein